MQYFHFVTALAWLHCSTLQPLLVTLSTEWCSNYHFIPGKMTTWKVTTYGTHITAQRKPLNLFVREILEFDQANHQAVLLCSEFLLLIYLFLDNLFELFGALWTNLHCNIYFSRSNKYQTVNLTLVQNFTQTIDHCALMNWVTLMYTNEQQF